MDETDGFQPYSSIVPILIDLCAKPAQKDRPGRKAHTDALFSILRSSAVVRPAITTHWLLALNRKSPETRPATVLRLMSRALRNSTKDKPEQALILSADILNQTRQGSELSDIAKGAFCRAFDAAMRKDRLAARIPLLAAEAAKAVFDDRGDALKAHIRRGTMQAQIRPQS